MSHVHRYNLLIAEDDEALRETLRDLLSPFLQTIVARSGEEAVSLVEQQPVHLALFDMHMQELTGLETIRIVKAELELVPCILMTADWTTELESEASKAQAYCVLKKPVARQVLLGTLISAVECVYHDGEFRRKLLAG